LVDDVEEASDFYCRHLGFTLLSNQAPAYADVVRGNLHLLLSGPTSSGETMTARHDHRSLARAVN